MSAMAAHPARIDCLVVGDIAMERQDRERGRALAGVAARIAAHAAVQGARVALVAKTGADGAGGLAREMLHRLRVDLRYVFTDAALATTTWQPGPPPWIRRGADMALRLDEVPSPVALPAAMVVASGYSLSVEPARSAVLGALRSSARRGGRALLVPEADLLWQTNARITRPVLEPALAAAEVVVLTAADARVLAGTRWTPDEVIRRLRALGPTVVLLLAGPRSLLVEGRQHHPLDAGEAAPADAYAAPGAFAAGLAAGFPARRAALEAIRYASAVRRPGAPHSPRTATAAR